MGENHRPGRNGELLWCPGCCPAARLDVTAARRFASAEKVVEFVGLLADLGYVSLHPEVIVGWRVLACDFRAARVS